MKKSYTTLNEEVTRIKTIMGIISEDKEILKEIGGGGSQPYKWKIIKRDELDDMLGLYIYEFSTDSNVEYEVTITRPTKEMTQVLRQSQKDEGEPVIEREVAYNRIEIQFGVTAIDGKKVDDGKEIVCDENGCSGGGFDSNIIINRGELYRVMSTVVKIVKSFISTHPAINELFIVPAKENIKDIRRLNLYIHYAQTQWPDADVKVDNYPELGGEIIYVGFKSEIDALRDRFNKIKLTDPEETDNKIVEALGKCGKCYLNAFNEAGIDYDETIIELFKKEDWNPLMSHVGENIEEGSGAYIKLIARLIICKFKCDKNIAVGSWNEWEELTTDIDKWIKNNLQIWDVIGYTGYVKLFNYIRNLWNKK